MSPRFTHKLRCYRNRWYPCIPGQFKEGNLVHINGESDTCTDCKVYKLLTKLLEAPP